MTLKFRYKSVNRPDGTTVKAPMIPITFIGEKESFETAALVDSGADVSAMPRAIAEILELDLTGERAPASGIGGKVESIEILVKIMIGRGHEIYTFARTPFKIILDKYEFPILLGRAGFFDKFVITFDQRNETTSLKRVQRRIQRKKLFR